MNCSVALDQSAGFMAWISRSQPAFVATIASPFPKRPQNFGFALSPKRCRSGTASARKGFSTSQNRVRSLQKSEWRSSWRPPTSVSSARLHRCHPRSLSQRPAAPELLRRRFRRFAFAYSRASAKRNAASFHRETSSIRSLWCAEYIGASSDMPRRHIFIILWPVCSGLARRDLHLQSSVARGA